MENWKKCRFDFQTCLHSNQDYSDKALGELNITKSTSSKIGPPPPGGQKKNREKMCKTYACHCILGLFWLILREFGPTFGSVGLFCLFWASFGLFLFIFEGLEPMLGPSGLFRLIFRGFGPILAQIRHSNLRF